MGKPGFEVRGANFVHSHPARPPGRGQPGNLDKTATTRVFVRLAQAPNHIEQA